MASVAPAKVEFFEDGRSCDQNAVRFIEKRWIEKQMKDREKEFTESSSSKIFCGTWNVNAKKNENESLTGWLKPNTVEYDVYVIGFQEIVDLTAVNVAVESKSLKQSQYWQEEIEGVLGIKYKRIVAQHLVGLLLCVYVKESLQNYIKDIRCTTAGVGVMGMLGNKGGISAHFYLYDSAVCVVCAHLAAHRENVTGRNADYQNIIMKTVFSADTIVTPLPMEELKHIENLRSLGLLPPDASELSIIDHDIVFWIGDLNYRIDESVTMEEVFGYTDNNDIAFLRERDQLNIERARNHVFEGFSEGDLNFLPTYKYQIGTESYDRRPEKKIRAPAWCDRVLWKIKEGLQFETVSLLSYERSELKSSDHKPVFASFDCQLRRIHKSNQRAVYQEVTKLLDKFNNDAIPRIDVVGSPVELGTVYFQIPAVASVHVRNTGTVRAPWRFVPKFADTKYCRPWLSVTPNYGILLPDEVVELTVTLLVTADTAHALNIGNEVLSDIMVLRVENGMDFFLSVNANFARSCYGMSLIELMCTLQPVRTTLPPADREAPRDKNAVASYQPELGIPKEIWRLVDVLFRDGSDAIDVFVAEGDPDEMFQIREALDNGTDFLECSPVSFASALLQLLESLPEPLIPPEHYPTVELDEQNVRTWSRRFLESLPVPSYNVFVYLMSFFRELLTHHKVNRLTPAKLAAVSVKSMVRTSGVSKDDMIRVERMQTAIVYFLTTSAI